MRRISSVLAIVLATVACGRTALDPNQVGRRDGGVDGRAKNGPDSGPADRANLGVPDSADAAIVPDSANLIPDSADSAGPQKGLGTPSATGPLITRRFLHTATLLQSGLVLLAGGYGPWSIDPATPAYLRPAELYGERKGTFMPTGQVTGMRAEHTATLLADGKVLIAGGAETVPKPVLLDELYDPAKAQFAQTAGLMVTPRRRHTATLLNNGRVLIAGGFGTTENGDPVATAELYDPATGRFTATGSMRVATADHTATLLPNGKVLILGGRNSVYPARAELYDPSTETFVDGGKTIYERYGHVATALENGDVLVTGGWGGGPVYRYLANSELYSASTGTISEVGAMRIGRGGHAATRLADGKVLVTGGWADGSAVEYLSSAELYDPKTRSFAVAPSLAIARTLHTATLLQDGKVLIAGGRNATEALWSAELYEWQQ